MPKQFSSLNNHGGVILAFEVLLCRSTELSHSPMVPPLKLMDSTPSHVSSSATQVANGLSYPQLKDVRLYWINCNYDWR
jgi:hypothetical protein